MPSIDEHLIRRKLADHVLDPAHSPISCLGAVTSMLRLYGGKHEKILADAVDGAVKQTIAALKAGASSR